MRSCLIALGVALALFQTARAQAQVVVIAHSGTTVESARNRSLAQLEIAAGKRNLYDALADQARAKALHELVATRLMAIRSLQGNVESTTEEEGPAVDWPVPLKEKQFAADVATANEMLLAWTTSPDGLRNVEKQKLRTALVSMRLKLKRRPASIAPVDNRSIDAFLNEVAHTVIGPRASLD